MTREELKRARQEGGAVDPELVEEITIKIWQEFGKIQRDHPDLDLWQVVYRLDLDLDEPINEAICLEISNRVAAQYIGQDYPYELASVELLQDEDGHYVVCVFREERSEVSITDSDDDVDDEISFDSDLSIQPKLHEVEVDLEGADL